MYIAKFMAIGFAIMCAVAIAVAALVLAGPVLAEREDSGGSGDRCSSGEPAAQASNEAPAPSISTVAALAVLYVSTNGDDWSNRTNWMSDFPLSQWYGVTTDAEGRVTGLALGDNGLTGSIPRQLANISSLERLDLSCNDLSGAIPKELGRLTSLKVLDLSLNELSGTVPKELGRLTSLKVLDLSLNELSGTIPKELGQLTGLQQLNLSFNDLSGATPKELGNLSSLQRLNLSFNDLSGHIPSELHGLINLEALNLSANRLAGGIPPEFSSLVKLKTMRMWGNNNLGGCVPSELRDQGLNIDWSMRYCDPAQEPVATPSATTTPQPASTPSPVSGPEARMIVAPGIDVILQSLMPLSHA